MKSQAQRRFHFSSLLSFIHSVRVRLTLWYAVTTLIILFAVGWSVISGTQGHLPADAQSSQIETQLEQQIASLTTSYKQALLSNQPPASQQLTLPSREVVLLLHPDGSILDTRGPLTDAAIQQMQARAQKGQVAFNLTFPQTPEQSRAWGWWTTTNAYQVFITPILDQNTRIATLVIGLSYARWMPTPLFWFVHIALLFLISIIGGFWLASKAMSPVRMITRMASQINSTDLRRRLHLKRHDEFGELAATFDQMLSRLEAAFKRQTQFTADASHELRTPLTIIELEINRALTQPQSNQTYQQVLEQIQTENGHMIAIVNSLLLLARADTGRLDLKPEEIDLSDIALSSVERLLPLAQQHQIALSTGALPELLVLGDQQYLACMMTNLVENAIKYTHNIGTKVHISLTISQGRWGVICVQDDGPGIAKEDLPYLFERFYRVDKARTANQIGIVPAQTKPGGTGLGLAIVQWIVQAHGGEVRVESKIGTGSIFEVRLPLLKKTPDKET